MGIVINHSENIFLLQTRSNSYAFGIDDQGLAQKGLVELELIPGTRNKKRILLTDAGRELEKNTTDRLRGAEIRAYGKLSVEELNSYLEMTRKLTAALREETEKL